MHPKSILLLKVLINKYHPGIGENFLRILPQSDAKEVIKKPVDSSDPLVAINWPKTALIRTHYSWLAPIIQKMPASIQPLVVASLPEPQSTKLKNYLKLPHIPRELNPKTKPFFLDTLYKKWNPQEAIPTAYLPTSTLSPLLELSKAELVDLIDFLALYDLAEAIRHIVDKKYLKTIYFCLTTKQQQYLRQCLHQKEKLATPSLGLEKWDGDPKKLKVLLHLRGMLRLGKALCGQSPDFLWHVVHTLDTGRGTTLASHYHNEIIANVTPLLVQQVLNLLNFLKPKSPT